MSEAKSFRKQVLSLLGETYGDRTLVLCPTVFVRLLGGDHKAAILLSQILYWSDKTKDPDGYFYKSYADWQTETGLSEAQVRRIVNGDPRVQGPQLTLRDLGVETLLRKVRHTGAPTLHYRINQNVFLSQLHTALGQGDPQHCTGSTPDIAQDEPAPLARMNPEQSGASSDPEIPAQTPSDKITSLSSDDDLDIFRAYEDRLGKLKTPDVRTVLTEMSRLGVERVGVVLARCATRGRSWRYVLKALANESPANADPEAIVDTHWKGTDALDNLDDYEHPQTPENAPVAVSERLQTPWQRDGKPLGTVADAWEAARQQLELQFGSDFYVWGRGLTLVDFEGTCFTVVARNAYARDLLEYRLNRSVERILSDIYGRTVTVRYLLSDQWGEQGIVQVA